jgi:hypothetical protein
MNDFSINLTGNTDLGALEAQLARELDTIANRAIAQWISRSDSAFEAALRTLIVEASDAVYQELLSSVLQTGVSGGSGGSSGDFQQAITDLIVAKINDIISPTKPTVTTRETERSQNAEASFRLSRSQAQAQAARDAMAGQRNL